MICPTFASRQTLFKQNPECAQIKNCPPALWGEAAVPACAHTTGNAAFPGCQTTSGDVVQPSAASAIER